MNAEVADLPNSESEPVRARPVYAMLLWTVLGFFPGFIIVDSFVAWWDRAETPEGEGGSWVTDERLGWTPRPHYVNEEFETRLDGLGMRSEPIPADADPTEVRILAVGASRLYGAAGALQSEIWNYQLDALLAADAEAPPVRILNGSVMAYSEVQVCRRAIDLIDEVEPDLVIVALSPRAQMLLDPSVTRHWVRVGDELVQQDVLEGWPEALHPAVAAGHRLLSKSALYRRKRAKFSVGDDNRDAAVQRWLISRAENEPAVDEMLERTWGEMRALGSIARERGIEVRVMLMAEQYMDTDERWVDFCVSHSAEGAPPPDTPRLEPLEVLAEKCAELGLEAWDFLPEIEEVGRARRRMLNDDRGHWSGDGHAVIARGLEQRLRAENLLQELHAQRQERPR